MAEITDGDREFIDELCEMQRTGSLYNPDYEHALTREQREQRLADYRERCEQAARDERDAEWREAADNSFEDIQSNEALLRVFPDLPEAIIHEIWKRDPRVQAARDAERKRVLGVLDSSGSIAELTRRIKSGEAVLDPDGRLAGAQGKANG